MVGIGLVCKLVRIHSCSNFQEVTIVNNLLSNMCNSIDKMKVNLISPMHHIANLPDKESTLITYFQLILLFTIRQL